MDGPGEYIADSTEGITRVENLPPPRIERRSRDYRRRRCPFCEGRARRYGVARRILHDLGDARSDRPLDIHLTYSKHQCSSCRRCFNADMDDLAPALHISARLSGWTELETVQQTQEPPTKPVVGIECECQYALGAGQTAGAVEQGLAQGVEFLEGI